MAKKKTDPIPVVPREGELVAEKEELVPVLLPNMCISHWVPKNKVSHREGG